MKVICSYCAKHLDDIAPLDEDRISHGMCDDCYAYFERQLDGLSLNAFLDGFTAPVLIVDQAGRVAALNRMAAGMLGKSEREVLGLLGGEAMECRYARLPGGCGKTVHCEACTIRIAVNRTVETGKPIEKAPVRVRRRDKEMTMMISTDYIDGLVRIVIDPVPD